MHPCDMHPCDRRCNMHPCNMQHAPVQHATCNMHPCNMHRAACGLHRATRNGGRCTIQCTAARCNTQRRTLHHTMHRCTRYAVAQLCLRMDELLQRRDGLHHLLRSAGVSPVPAQMRAGVSPVPAQMWAGVSPVPAQMWAGVSPVPAQMWAGAGPVQQRRDGLYCLLLYALPTRAPRDAHAGTTRQL
jgi:hypothetical protein